MKNGQLDLEGCRSDHWKAGESKLSRKQASLFKNQYVRCQRVSRAHLGLGKVRIFWIDLENPLLIHIGVAHRGLTNGNATAAPIPSQPSALVLTSLKSLVIAIRRVSPRQLQSNSSITSSLIAEFQTRCLDLAQELVSLVQTLEGDQKKNVAIQSLWDLSFLRRFWGQEKKEHWEEITQTLSSVSSLSFFARLRVL